MAPPATLVSKLKVHLKTSISRLRIVQAKDTALAKQQRRSMAQLIESGKIESARIRVENIIRSDLITELHEILELYCELLLARAGLLDGPTIDPGLEEPIRSIIYAAPRTEIKELQQARQCLMEKYGKEFALSCTDDAENKVPPRIKRKLAVEPPSEKLVQDYLEAIASAYDIPFGNNQRKDDDAGDDDQGGKGELVEADKEAETGKLEEPLSTDELKTMSPPRNLEGRSPVTIAPPSPSTERPDPRPKMPDNAKVGGQAVKKAVTTSKPPPANKPEGNVPSADDLEKRFALLKRP